MKKILFVVTSFNNAPYIEDTIFSILKQKGGFLKDILIVDDGSEDNSPFLIRKLMKKYHNIKLLTQENKGQAAALNRALSWASSYNFLAFVEADVKIEKEWLLKNLKKFQKSNIVGVGGRLQPFSSDTWIARLAGYEAEYKMERQKDNPCHLTSANVIYRSFIFSRLGKFKEELRNSCFDGEFNLRLIRAGFHLVYNREAFAWHHYKNTLGKFLKRTYVYARYRPYLKGVASYPYDKMIQIQIGLLLIILLNLPLILINNTFSLATYYSLLTTYLLLATYFLLTLPPVLWTLKHKKDWVILLYPLISFLRNSVALAALACGTLEYIFKKIMKP